MSLSFLFPGIVAAQIPIEITEFPVQGNPIAITTGSDGNFWMWFSGTSTVGRLTTSGVFTAFNTPIPFSASTPGHCVDGTDGGVWFATFGPIGRVSTSSGGGSVFPLPPGSGARDLTLGPDGALWFTDPSTNGIGRMTLGGLVTEYTLPGAFVAPQSITVGPDNAVWFTGNIGQVGRLDLNGSNFRFYNLPEYPTTNAQFSAIAMGPDGNLWLGILPDAGPGRVARVSSSGQVSEFTLPDPAGSVMDIVAGPDRALWFTQQSANKIGRISTSGVLTEYDLQPSSGPTGITVGRDGAIWFTELAGRVGRISGGPLTPSAVPTLTPPVLLLFGVGLAMAGFLCLRVH